jgi:tetratricopeptide (TPR) repeat protein
MTVEEPTMDTVWDHHPDVHTVQAAFDRVVASRQGRVVLVAGGPATGRTGLARALATRLRKHPAHPAVIAGGFRGDEWEPWLPVASRRDALQTGMDLAIKALELGGVLGVPAVGAVAKLLGQLAGTSSAALALLSRHIQDNQPLRGGSGPGAVREVLRVAASPQPVVGRQPVVCVLDDLDRAREAQEWWQGLVVRLAGELRDLPLLLVVTLEGPAELGEREPGEPAGLFAARRLVEAGVGIWVPVARLDVAAVTRWLWPCEPGLAERLWEVTGGEPSWLGELWDHWRVTRTVRRDLPGQWVLGAPESPALGKVHDLLWEQIEHCYGGMIDDDQLDSVVRVLAIGALEGRQFTAQAAAMVVDRDADELIDEFDEHLLASPRRPDGLLQEAGFVQLVDSRAPPDGSEPEEQWLCRYQFVSELHWRTLRRYGLPGRERQDACRTLATALEGVWQPEPERAAALIASLLREAGDYQAAASWQTLAELGRAAVPVVEARARLLLAQDTSGWDRFDHAQAARQLGQAMFQLWEHRSIELVLEIATGWARAAQAAGWQSEHARALRHCGLLHLRLWELGPAVACFRQARREAVAAGDLGLAARAMAERAGVEAQQGRVHVARRRAEAARQLAHRHDAPDVEATALDVLAGCAWRVGDWEGALMAAEAGVALAERAGNRERLALLLQNMSDAQYRLGQVGPARETVAQARDLFRQVGRRSLEGWAEWRLGTVWEAEPPAAEQHLLRALRIARQLNDIPLEALCHVSLADVARGRGDVRAVGGELKKATRFANTLGDPELAANVWRGWARLAEAQGVPGRRVAVLWALAAMHADRASSADAPSFWEIAERAAAGRLTRTSRKRLAAHAHAALARDGGWELLKEVFGPLDIDGSAATGRAVLDG